MSKDDLIDMQGTVVAIHSGGLFVDNPVAYSTPAGARANPLFGGATVKGGIFVKKPATT